MENIRIWLLKLIKAACSFGMPPALMTEPNVRELDDWLKANMPELWQKVRCANDPFVIYSLLYEVCCVDGWHKVALSDSIVESTPVFLARLKEIKAHGPHQHIQ